jgi:hypothetical protein
MSAEHIYVDETKRAGYVLAAVTVADPSALHQLIRSLILPSGRRIHMHNEAPAGAVRSSPPSPPQTSQPPSTTPVCRFDKDLQARSACLAAIWEYRAVSPARFSVHRWMSTWSSKPCFDQVEPGGLGREAVRVPQKGANAACCGHQDG